MTPTTPYTIRVDTELLDKSIKGKSEDEKKKIRKKAAKLVNNHLKKITGKCTT